MSYPPAHNISIDISISQNIDTINKGDILLVWMKWMIMYPYPLNTTHQY